MIVSICDTSILRRNEQDHKQFRGVVKKWLKENYLNKSFLNFETGCQIYITNSFIDKSTSSFGDVKAHSFTAIPDIVKNAIFIIADEDKKARPDIIKVLKFESLILVDEIQYKVWMYVRQTKTELHLYSLNINVQKTP